MEIVENWTNLGLNPISTIIVGKLFKHTKLQFSLL